jgi:hypothetical protein
MRKYELKDHLGNVRVVVGDIKQAQNFDYRKPFLAEVHGVNTYYPFGSLQPKAEDRQQERLNTSISIFSLQ